MFLCKTEFCKKNDAFVLIYVLIFSAVLALLSLITFQKINYSYQICFERETFYRNFYITEMILDKTLIIIKRDFAKVEKILQKEGAISWDGQGVLEEIKNKKDKFFDKIANDVSCQIKIENLPKVKNKFLLSVFLTKEKENLCVIFCVFFKDAKSEENELFTSYFTLRSVI
ncbi:TPA: hypothetical protein DEO28_03620 [Candidatus Dependentiae bacterium]|nr:MAG: hypothetical protein UR14_C0007G0025 [candidate division TM6 bacterium GW2011_GWE2_31_21]KKP53614.1 MAG: hypothetical protein UR43_C0004G0155 [candidate division TM6 bacterium GW2011_GWF2_33_332]HBS48146.1 hypothetical protein [Candidatus Dependentiae bacterium]HBZ73570.1 hypothetical protein [Candidatus Dependentiae bacterium]